MRSLLLFTALFGLITGGVTSAYAQDADNADDLIGYLADVSTHESLLGKVQQILQHDEAQFSPECSDVISMKLATIDVFEVPKLNEDNAPVSGHWMARYSVKVCDERYMRAIHFRADDSGLSLSSLLPGNTQADPRLQVDVTKSFKMAVSKAYPDCTTPFVADTRILSMPKNGDAPWEELWVAHVCGNVFGQAIRFVPQEEGTAFSLDIATGQKADVQ